MIEIILLVVASILAGYSAIVSWKARVESKQAQIASMQALARVEGLERRWKMSGAPDNYGGTE